MLSEEDMRKAINESIANLLAEAIYSRILEKMQPQWDRITEELVNSLKANNLTATRLLALEQLIEKQMQQTESLSVERTKLRETAIASLQILRDAKQSLGLE